MPYSARRIATLAGPSVGEKVDRLSSGTKLSRLQVIARGNEILVVKPGGRGKRPHVLGVLDRADLSFDLTRLSGRRRKLPSAEAPGRVDPITAGKRPEEGAKARALLRGKLIAEQDLESSGGAVSLTDVQQIMNGVTRQAVTNRVKEGSLIAVPGPSNRRIYPVVQFVDGVPVKGLKEVRAALGTISGVAILNFLVNKEPRIGSRRPIDLLKAGDLDRVLEVARRGGIQGA